VRDKSVPTSGFGGEVERLHRVQIGPDDSATQASVVQHVAVGTRAGGATWVNPLSVSRAKRPAGKAR
jgi:hypothetical protein